MKNLINIFAILCLAIAPQAVALTVDTPLSDPQMEEKAREVFYEIRCVVCQNESIAESPAEVAADMRRGIREMVESGKNGEEIKEILSAQYGDVILMKPPLKQSTLVLWFAPMVFLIMGMAAIFLFFRKKEPAQGEA